MCIESDVLVKRIKKNKMKKQNSIISNLSVKGMITISILSAMLFTFNANNAKANSKPPRAFKLVNVEMDSKNAGDLPLFSNSEALSEAVEAVKYSADEFVQAEIALETQSWISRNAEAKDEAAKHSAEQAVQTEMTLETQDNNLGDANLDSTTYVVEPSIKIGYHASEFVDSDMATEINNWNSKSGF